MIFSNINFKENDFFVAQFLKSKNSPKKNIQSLISTDVQIPEPESPQTIHTATDQQVQTTFQKQARCRYKHKKY